MSLWQPCGNVIGGGKKGWAEDVAERIALWQLFLSLGCEATALWNLSLKAYCRLCGATVLWLV